MERGRWPLPLSAVSRGESEQSDPGCKVKGFAHATSEGIRVEGGHAATLCIAPAVGTARPSTVSWPAMAGE